MNDEGPTGPAVTEGGRRDGTIDFSLYSQAQLRDLQYSIDGQAFPKNLANLLDELRRREAADTEQQPNPAAIGASFTSRGGVRGWLEALFRRQPVYGDGSVEPGASETIVRGWRRTWLGMPIPVELALPTACIRNVFQDGERVEFDAKRRFRLTRRFRFRVDTPEQGRALAGLLPATQTSRFERNAGALRDFDRRLRATGRAAWVTPSIVAANAALFLAMSLSGMPGGKLDEIVLSTG